MDTESPHSNGHLLIVKNEWLADEDDDDESSSTQSAQSMSGYGETTSAVVKTEQPDESFELYSELNLEPSITPPQDLPRNINFVGVINCHETRLYPSSHSANHPVLPPPEKRARGRPQQLFPIASQKRGRRRGGGKREKQPPRPKRPPGRPRKASSISADGESTPRFDRPRRTPRKPRKLSRDSDDDCKPEESLPDSPHPGRGRARTYTRPRPICLLKPAGVPHGADEQQSNCGPSQVGVIPGLLESAIKEALTPASPAPEEMLSPASPEPTPIFTASSLELTVEAAMPVPSQPVVEEELTPASPEPVAEEELTPASPEPVTKDALRPSLSEPTTEDSLAPALSEPATEEVSASPENSAETDVQDSPLSPPDAQPSSAYRRDSPESPPDQTSSRPFAPAQNGMFCYEETCVEPPREKNQLLRVTTVNIPPPPPLRRIPKPNPHWEQMVDKRGSLFLPEVTISSKRKVPEQLNKNAVKRFAISSSLMPSARSLQKPDTSRQSQPVRQFQRLSPTQSSARFLSRQPQPRQLQEIAPRSPQASPPPRQLQRPSPPRKTDSDVFVFLPKQPHKDKADRGPVRMDRMANMLQQVLVGRWTVQLSPKSLEVRRLDTIQNSPIKVIISTSPGNSGLSVHVNGRTLPPSHSMWRGLSEEMTHDGCLRVGFVLQMIAWLNARRACMGHRRANIQGRGRYSNLCPMLVLPPLLRCAYCRSKLVPAWKTDELEGDDDALEVAGGNAIEKGSAPDKPDAPQLEKIAKVEELFLAIRTKLQVEMEKLPIEEGTAHRALVTQEEVMGAMGLRRRESAECGVRKSKREKKTPGMVVGARAGRREELEFLTRNWDAISDLFSANLNFGTYSQMGIRKLAENHKRTAEILAIWHRLTAENPGFLADMTVTTDSLDYSSSLSVEEQRLSLSDRVKEIKRLKRQFKCVSPIFRKLFNAEWDSRQEDSTSHHLDDEISPPHPVNAT